MVNSTVESCSNIIRNYERKKKERKKKRSIAWHNGNDGEDYDDDDGIEVLLCPMVFNSIRFGLDFHDVMNAEKRPNTKDPSDPLKKDAEKKTIIIEMRREELLMRQIFCQRSRAHRSHSFSIFKLEHQHSQNGNNKFPLTK